MRSISSSFKTSMHETPPQSSKSSILSDRDDADHWKVKQGDAISTSSLSIKSVSSTPKNPIRTFLGSATTIVRHGRDHQIAPSKPPSKIPATIQSLTWRQLFTPGLGKKKYGFPMDSASSSTISGSPNRRSFTSDHAAETVKLYTKEVKFFS